MINLRLGLFQHIYLRVVAVIAAALILMLVYSQFHQSRVLVDAWRQDLQQEAVWLSTHTRSDENFEQFVTTWRVMHDGVRLRFYDQAGALIADSHKKDAHQPPIGDYTIEARAPLTYIAAGGELVLSRSGLSLFPNRLESGLVITALLLFLMAAGLLLPLTRQVTKTFGRLSELAARVAEGQFGATIPPQGDRDLKALVSSFNAMSSGLKDAELRNRQLLIDVSHEFRSPLARLTALTDTLQRHPDEAPELLERVRGELKLLDRLTGDALTGAEFSPEKSKLERETVDLRAWVDDAFARLSAPSENFIGRFDISINIASEEIMIDPQRVMQVLGNVVDNARKALAGRDDGVISLGADANREWLTIQISDNGPGIDEKDLPFVFDRFYRASTSQADDQAGSGLGLSIARELVAAHGGNIELRSSPGGGVCADIRFPLGA